MIKKIIAGIVGSGFAAHLRVKALKKISGNRINIKGIYDIDALHAKEFSHEINASVYGSFEEMLEDGTLNTIIVCVPNKFHYRIVKDALEKGAHLITGGKRLTEGPLEKGYFYAPTVLTHVTKEMRIYREETFGPVAPIIAYDPDDDVIEMANDTVYGLAAYVYTKSTSRAMSAFERLKFGIIGINDINPTSAAAPFGGMKDSGMGREGSKEGINEYLETKLGGFSI